MIRILIFAALINVLTTGYGQNDKISTVDFVQILDDNEEEAMYYFQNNWKVLRDMAVNRGFIDSYRFLEVPPSADAPFHLIFITTYLNEEQYNLREDHFAELIEEKGPLRLLNSKKPEEFRKSLFVKEKVRDW